ncbi:MAG: hypothetical protein FJ214_07095 [Ignavibacteria bacterium]|nr:hypothetical protein [Ignavibacteria bacterium]
MDFSMIIKYVQNNTSTLARAYFDQVKKSEFMHTYQKLDESKVIAREETVFVNLIKWLESGASNDEAEKYFEKVGAERFNEGFPLTEINYALYITKKVFWSFIAWKKELFEKMDFHQVVEHMTIVNNYFDLGSFYIIRGYIRELIEKLDETAHVSKGDIQRVLTKGALDNDDLDKSEIIWRHI